MILNPLYYTILEKPFFIDVRRIESRQLLIHQLVTRDLSAEVSDGATQRPPVGSILSVIAPSGKQNGGSFTDAPAGSVAVIPLKGDMIKQGTRCTYGTEELAAQLDEATAAPGIIGTVLDVDSGGGAVDAIWPLTEAIGRSQQAGKPVVASCDLCASAAYYVASACDRIVACNELSSEFGSIGVMVQFADYMKYFEREGITVHTIYSSLSDYKNAPFEAALKGDYKAIREEMLDPLARQFQQHVRSRRPSLDDSVDGILQGRMFYARDALKHGLIDQTGTMADAVEQVRRLSADAQLRRLALR